MVRKSQHIAAAALSLCCLVSCSYNPFSSNNRTTGNATGPIIGAAIGGGAVAAVGGTKPFLALGTVGGALAGYYFTTLQYESGGINHVGGQVYKIGDVIGMYIPTDNLFESNTDELLPQASPTLDSAVLVLAHYPNNNIIISGNTSGFYRAKWEQKLSERRAQKVAAYLWNAGINNFKEQSIDTRKLMYVGYGDYFPIANHYTNDGIRANSRIQIVSYPTSCDMHLDKRHVTFRNYGAYDDSDMGTDEKCDGC